uniref:Uncharacterized protein n=1 Tax=Panagrellus redivivus TaxID=6233 RepID=A0A7E4V563_PANRE
MMTLTARFTCLAESQYQPNSAPSDPNWDSIFGIQPVVFIISGRALQKSLWGMFVNVVLPQATTWGV